MQNDLRYFRVTGGAVRAAYDRFIVLRQLHTAAREAERDRWGATDTYANGHGLQGLFYQDLPGRKAGQVPSGWQPLSEPNVWAPSKRTKEGRAIHEAWAKLPLAGAQEFQAEVLGRRDVFYFMQVPRVRHMVFERLDDVLILLVPKIPVSNTEPVGPGDSADATPVGGYKWQPPDADCAELKTSEYWNLKELAESKGIVTD